STQVASSASPRKLRSERKMRMNASCARSSRSGRGPRMRKSVPCTRCFSRSNSSLCAARSPLRHRSASFRSAVRGPATTSSIVRRVRVKVSGWLCPLVLHLMMVGQPRRVVLINGNALLRHQIDVALAAWNLEVMPVESPPLIPQMPRAALRAREIAAEHGASGVVWIGELAHEYSLWFYDAATDQVVTRPLGGGEPG